MTLARSEREWAILVNEYNICKKKLNSKREALKILTSDLELCQRERDIYKTKIKQLVKEVDDFKKKETEQENLKQAQKPNSSTPVKKRGSSFSGNSVWEQELQNVRERKQKTLSQMLCESRAENKALKKDMAELRQLYRDSQEDIQLLHDVMAKQKNRTNSIKAGDGDLDPRQDLIAQLEMNQEKMMELERDKMAISDEKAEIATERDHYKDKSERLNTQLNFILGADDRRLVDIDSVLMENRYLKEQIKQLREEKNMAVSALARYKNIFEKRKNKILQAQLQGSYGNTPRQAMPSLLSDLIGHLSSTSPATSTVSDLQFLANSLSETLSEKDTALQHLRSANKILGHRVAELEKKLKTLEVSGLWSLQGHRGYGSTEADKLSQEAIYCQLKALIPGKEKQANGDNDDQSSTPENTERGSEPSSPSSPGWGVAQQSPTFDLNSLQGEVEEGMLVNVSGGSGDELEELGCLELGDVSDNDELDEATDKITLTDACNIDVSTQAEDPDEDSCGNEEISKLAEKCNREFESVVDSNCNNKNDSTNSSDTNDTEVINKDIDP